MRRRGLPTKYRRWLFRFSAVLSILATGAALLGGDPLGAVSSALVGVWAGLAAYDFDTSPQLGRRWLFRCVAVAGIVLALYRILFTFASPT